MIFAFILSTLSVAQTWYDSVSANPSSLLPLTNTDGETTPITNLMFESLATRHWDTYEWTPQIAEKWEVSKDGKEFTFFIDPKAKFWDGTSVTAEDVKFSFDVIFMDGVETASLKPYYEKIESVQIVNPKAVRFKVKETYFKNFDVAAGLTIFPRKHYLDLYKKDKSLAKAESVRNPMGTGPFQMEKWDQNQQVVLRRNPNYWDKDRMIREGRWNRERVIFRVIPDMAVEFETFKKGDLTMLGLTSKQWMLQTNTPEFKTRITKVQTTNKAAVGFGFIGWNNKHEILGNKDVRWALSHVVNLPLWIKKFEFDMHEPTISIFSPKGDEHDPAIKAVPYDLEAARKRLAAAGWTKPGKDGILMKDNRRFSITVMYPTSSKDVWEPKLTEFKNSAKRVGIEILLKAVEWTSFTKLLDDRNFEAVVLGWSRELEGDPKQIWHSDSIAEKGSNFVQYANTEVDKAIDAYRVTMDRAERIKFARNIQRLVYEDQPYTFLSERKYSLYAHQNYVQKKQDTYQYTIGTSFWQLKNDK